MLVELEMSVELSHWLICLGFESKVFSSCQSLLDPDDDRVSGTKTGALWSPCPSSVDFHCFLCLFKAVTKMLVSEVSMLGSSL